MSASDESLRQGGKTIPLADVMASAAVELKKRVTVTVTLDPCGKIRWNDDVVTLDAVSDRIAEAAADGTFVRVILDNRAGAEFSVVERVLTELDAAYLADYRY